MRVNSSLLLRCSVCLLLIPALFAGCAKTRQGRSVEPSGFLGDYSKFRKGEGEEAQLVYLNPKVKDNFSHYNKIMIDKITVYSVEGSKLDKLDKEQVESLVAYLNQSLTTELSKDYQIVDKPGPDVLKLRAAITESRGSKVVLDSISTIIPQFRLLSAGGQLIGDTSVVVGKARVEAELCDSVTGERLGAAVDERSGSKALKGVFTKWSDVRDAYDHWAIRLRERLAELRAGNIEGTPK